MKFHDFTRRVVIDTNVIVSALISTNGAAARFLGDVSDENMK